MIRYGGVSRKGTHGGRMKGAITAVVMGTKRLKIIFLKEVMLTRQSDITPPTNLQTMQERGA